MTVDRYIETLKQLSPTDVSDALDRLGLIGQCFGITPLDRSFRVVGRAWTIRYGPRGAGSGTVGDYIDDVGPNEVPVLDNQGRLDVTVWGDLLTSTAARRKVAGTIIDGICRDVTRSIELGYPIFSRGNWMRTGKDRVRVEGIQVPVSIGGVRVEHGDYVLGDADGVVIIPAIKVTDVLSAAVEISHAEAAIRAAVSEGVGLRDARAQYEYHSLQSKRK